MYARLNTLISVCWMATVISPVWAQSFTDKSFDGSALPQVPAGFVVTEFAREPLVRQPCSMAFDRNGRLYVGMGPQYRSPTRDTPGDSVVMFLDTNGDGTADTTKVFATGFNTIQALAWRGRDLWVANAPDLTIVRDLDGDDEADQYVRVYTDLGNLEHGLQGLTWAPDGKLYMSKGNSKGLNEPGRYAPKAFRDLWGLAAPDGVPDIPPPEIFDKNTYQRNYHDPDDDWGLYGGILRCDEDGSNLEIFARGFRNPWDIAMDHGFNWVGTDNDQVGGDRVIMPFQGAHFGWNHPWSSHWGTEAHPPTAPVSGPLFEGSGTGIVFGHSPQFPEEYRGVFFINDWLRKTTFVWRPKWDGALLRPEEGIWSPFIVGGNSLYRPTDIEFGPDGALWILGWGSGYGAEWSNGELVSEGRIFRVSWSHAEKNDSQPPIIPLDESSVEQLVGEFSSSLPVRQIDAQDELVRRGAGVHDQLLTLLQSGTLGECPETWTAWTLSRIWAASGEAVPPSVSEFFLDSANGDASVSLNQQIQAIRILARQVAGGPVASSTDADHNAEHNADQLGNELCIKAEGVYRLTSRHAEARVRMATVQAIEETRLTNLLPELLDLLQTETDPIIFYAGWQALRSLVSDADLRAFLMSPQPRVRTAALLGLLETHSLDSKQVDAIAANDSDGSVRQLAQLWMEKAARGVQQIVKGRPVEANRTNSSNVIEPAVAAITNLLSKGQSGYRVVPAGFKVGRPIYIDRPYQLKDFSNELLGYDLIQTANDDDNSSGRRFLSFEAVLPVRVLVGIDQRLKKPPKWLLKNFEKTDWFAKTDEGVTFHFYQSNFPSGLVELGGNTNDGQAGGKGNYVVAITPLPLPILNEPTTTQQVLEVLAEGDSRRGKVLFHHSGGAGCAKCHSLSEAQNGFGPNLSNLAARVTTKHIVESIVEPSAVITQGFNQLNVLTDAGQIFSGVLLEESGLTLSLGLSSGERVDIPKAMIEERSTSHLSAMPDSSTVLSPHQVADLTRYLISLQAVPAASEEPGALSQGFSVQRQNDRLLIWLDGRPITEFVFDDKEVLRPYFSNIRLPNGAQITRNHPPIEGVDQTDHSSMHPGLWLGFGDISGQDFWRNKASVKHIGFTEEPKNAEGRLTFSTECLLLTDKGQPLCQLVNQFALTARPEGWLITWHATFKADTQEVIFGDQEEMGFGARVATAITEKNSGRLLNSNGQISANRTWGQPAAWCDYSGWIGDQFAGITLMSSPGNFRASWWHNRDYGVFVANPFGRKSMKQGEESQIKLPKGESLRIGFGALIHAGLDTDFDREFNFFANTQILP